MSPANTIEFLLFGAPTLRRVDTGQVAQPFRPQVKSALASIVLEGDATFAFPDDRLIAALWRTDTGETGLPARLHRLVHEIRQVFSALDPDDDDHVEHESQKVRLRDIAVDARDFDLAYARREYPKALALADRGPLLDGLRLRGDREAYDWVERARGRYGTRVDRCYQESAQDLAREYSAGRAHIADIIDVVESRARSAMAYDLPDLAAHAVAELEKLRALKDSGALELAPAPALRPAGHRPGKLPLDRLLVTRLGSGLSLQVDPDHIDSTHHYTRVARTDLLDYPSGDFYSLRRLCGINASSEASNGLVYAESSEAKITFDSTETKAYDTGTRKRLIVESLLPSTASLFQHGFRILFPRALAPGEEFDVVFAIRLPGELAVLSPVEEMMSIALVRWEHGVDRLEFNVCLNFEPLAVANEFVGEDGEFAGLPRPPTLAPYVPKEWYERDLDIPWSSEPYVIACVVEQPTAPMYTIKYRV
jgi:DNA-binding SARP family transcriptional activator